MEGGAERRRAWSAVARKSPGPVEAKMVINALNSGADSYMTDFEDSNTPNWHNQMQGQVNLKAAVRRTIDAGSEAASTTSSTTRSPRCMVRPRGWHLEEKHVTIDGKRVSGGIFDFALFLFHNASEQIDARQRPVFLSAEDGKLTWRRASGTTSS